MNDTKFKENEILVVSRKGLEEVALKQRNRNCGTGDLRVGCVEGESWNVN